MNSILKYNLNKKNFIVDLLQHKNIENIETFLSPNETCEEDIHHLDNAELGINFLDEAISLKKKIVCKSIQSKLNYLASKYKDRYEIVYYNEGKVNKKGGRK